MAAAVFIFAHQDDEYGAYLLIENAVRDERRVVCIYLTDGGDHGQLMARRNQESVGVLTGLGVSEDEIHFLGEAERIPDGRLLEHLDNAFRAAKKILDEIRNIEMLHLLAWEGGHQDHDAAHIVGVALALQLQLLSRTVQFSLYNGAGLPGKLFRVLAPLEGNGLVTECPITWRDRLRYLHLMLSYRSQWKTWLGLYPPVLVAYLVKGMQEYQTINLDRLREPPHPGKLLYERRAYLSYAEFMSTVGPFLSRYVFGDNQPRVTKDSAA